MRGLELEMWVAESHYLYCRMCVAQVAQVVVARFATETIDSVQLIKTGTSSQATLTIPTLIIKSGTLLRAILNDDIIK